MPMHTTSSYPDLNIIETIPPANVILKRLLGPTRQDEQIERHLACVRHSRAMTASSLEKRSSLVAERRWHDLPAVPNASQSYSLGSLSRSFRYGEIPRARWTSGQGIRQQLTDRPLWPRRWRELPSDVPL